MKLRNVLILHKKSTYEIQAGEHRDARFIKLIEAGHEAVTRVKLAHDEHMETRGLLEKELLNRGVNFKSIARADLSEVVSDVDLMIAVGGDGTFLDASHHLLDVPILGVNSSSSSSFGHFCLANKRNLTSVLDQIESDAIAPHKILRLQLSVNGAVLPELVLNEVLVAHTNPAATSRYFIESRAVKEEQRSSGIWIGPPAGSTGSLRSAGAPVMKITDHRFQYFVREPCMRPTENWQLIHGVLAEDDELHIVSQMRTGNLYLDGQHIDYQFGIGDKLIVKASPNYLLSYIEPDVNDIFLQTAHSAATS